MVADSEKQEPSKASPVGSLLRSAGVGLAMGMGLGAVFLAVSSLRTVPMDCAGLSSEECDLMNMALRDTAHLQQWAAAACLALCAGLALWLRTGPKSK